MPINFRNVSQLKTQSPYTTVMNTVIAADRLPIKVEWFFFVPIKLKFYGALVSKLQEINFCLYLFINSFDLSLICQYISFNLSHFDFNFKFYFYF